MKNTTIFSAAVIAASSFAFSAYAQSAAPDVPGSDTVIEENAAATRDAVADNPGAATGATEADATTETLVPGSDALIQLNEATERDAVAAGTEGETTGGMAADGTTPLLVPGSGATMNESEAAASTTTTADVLQDEASTDAVK